LIILYGRKREFNLFPAAAAGSSRGLR
jgi:hypothetical protein